MTQTEKTRLLQSRAHNISRALLAGSSHETFTSYDRHAQRLVRRFGLSLSVASLVAFHAFGGRAHD